MVKITSQIKKPNNAYVMGRFTDRKKTNNVIVKITSQIKIKQTMYMLWADSPVEGKLIMSWSKPPVKLKKKKN